MTDTDKSTPFGPTEATFRAFIRTYGLVKRLQDPYFAAFGVSVSQWAALYHLWRAQEEGHPGLRLTDLGSRLLVRPPSITGVVDRLCRLGFVNRITAADDLRAKQVSLAPAGRELVERVMAEIPGRIRSLMGGLNEQEQAQLLQLLDRMAAHLDTMSAEK